MKAERNHFSGSMSYLLHSRPGPNSGSTCGWGSASSAHHHREEGRTSPLGHMSMGKEQCVVFVPLVEAEAMLLWKPTY